MRRNGSTIVDGREQRRRHVFVYRVSVNVVCLHSGLQNRQLSVLEDLVRSECAGEPPGKGNGGKQDGFHIQGCLVNETCVIFLLVEMVAFFLFGALDFFVYMPRKSKKIRGGINSSNAVNS